MRARGSVSLSPPGERAGVRGKRGAALLTLIAITIAALFIALSSTAARAEVPKPAVVIEKQGECVAPPDEMRRKHMDMLRHQRDKTLRDGVRGAKVSLNGCIECHASSKNGSVLGSNENFCQSCHAYAAVKIDCFECHQPTVRKSVAAAGEGVK